MLLSNRSELLWYYLFHSVHTAGTYGYITLVIFQRKTYLRVKKEWEKYILGKNYVQAQAFWRNGSYAPEKPYIFTKSIDSHYLR